MKLLKIKLYGSYKSLENFEWTFRSNEDIADKFEPLCLIGLNGAGKSNLIELLSEIFCYLDSQVLEYGKKDKKKFPFELEYLIKKTEVFEHIKVVNPQRGKLQFYKISDGIEESINKEECHHALPARIVGYSSGDNETISIPFMENQQVYSEEVTKQAFKDVNEQSEISPSKTIYMNYDANASILISNYLFSKNNEVSIFEETLRIKGVSSFRIILNLKTGSTIVKLTAELDQTIKNLKACALYHYNVGEYQQIFDYVVNDATKKAFETHFTDKENFYVSIYKLGLLNSLALTGEERKFYTQTEIKNGIIERPPVVAKKDKVFQIDKLKLTLSDPVKEIAYSAISDGEHQFIHIIGTLLLFQKENNLFLFDEPESHFNPKWRAEFIDIINKIEGISNQELLASTHSPFLVSSAHSRNVIKFVRDGEHVHAEHLNFETYGSSFEYLLAKLFHLDNPISKSALSELKKAVQSSSIEEVENAIEKFGDSLEKRFLFERLMQLQQEKN